MFSNPVKPDYRQDEGTVMQIDPKREVCKVVTVSGQKLDNVQWLRPYGGNERHGDRFTPRLGDRVLLNFGLGYPIIVGSLPRLQTGGQSYPLSLDSGSASVDAGNYAPGKSSLTADASKPDDMVLGDRVIGSQGGGILALLRAGVVVLRSSRAAEVFLSRLDGLVRIVGRNFEQFTDLSTDVYRNFRGRVYRYFGVSNSFAAAKVEDYKYHQYYGDTAAAEAVKANYHTPPGSIPATNSVIFKEQVTGTGGEKLSHTISLDGTDELKITGSSGFTRVKFTSGTVTLSFNDQHTVTIDSSKIDLTHSGGANVHLHAAGIDSTYSGHFVKINAGGVELG